MSVETSEDEDEKEEEREDETPTKILLTAAVCSFFIGALAAYATMNLGTAAMAVAFVVAVSGSGYYLSQMEFPEEVVGSSFYIAGALLLVAPTSLYLSNLFVGGEDVRLFSGLNSSVVGIFDGSSTELTEIGSAGEMLFGQGGPSFETVRQGSIEAIVPLVAWTAVFMIAALALFGAGIVLLSRVDEERRRKEQRTSARD